VAAGETVVVPAGTNHLCLNDEGREMRAIVTFKPAYDLEYWFETFCGMAQDGKWEVPSSCS
jgi:hypothetical protein